MSRETNHDKSIKRKKTALGRPPSSLAGLKRIAAELEQKLLEGKRRSYPGEREGLNVVCFLNTENEGRKKILVLLDLLKRLSVYGTVREGRLTLSPKNTEEFEQVQDMVSDFERQAAQYKATPTFLGPYTSFTWRLEETAEYGETGAALSLIELAKMGKIDSLRQCKQCKKWFFAKSSRQHFCPGGACQKEFDTNSPQAKERRNKTATNSYYLYHKDRRDPQYRRLTLEQFIEAKKKEKQDRHQNQPGKKKGRTAR